MQHWQEQSYLALEIFEIHKVRLVQGSIQVEPPIENGRKDEGNESGLVSYSSVRQHSFRHEIGPFEASNRAYSVGES
jgi:hypothetical protein